jgi:hypothetical protein
MSKHYDQIVVAVAENASSVRRRHLQEDGTAIVGRGRTAG